MDITVSPKEEDVFQFVKKYIKQCGYAPTDVEIAYEFEFSNSRASNIIRNLQYKERIAVGSVRRTVKVL